jgi:hypothetical protein
MNSQALSNSGGNVVQIQRIKLVPVNEILNRNPFLNTESRLGSGHSPRTIQQSQRDSNNNVGSTILSKSLILSNNGGTQASRFQSTQRSSFLQGTVSDYLQQQNSLSNTNVDLELPLKYKRFRNGMNQGLTDRDSIAAQITSIAQLKSQKNEMMKINTVRAREE